MGEFRDFVERPSSNDLAWHSFNVDEYEVRIWAQKDSADEVGLLREAREKGIPLGGKYSAQIHSAHTPKDQKHIHVYARRNQIFALNFDGTAHDQSHGVAIPNKVAKAIKTRFPQCKLPTNNLIESADEDLKTIVFAILITEG